jgi:hypothetical protein
MTELHNMSVPPRSVLTVQREALQGTRYRVVIDASAIGGTDVLDDAALTRCFREDGAACALAVLHRGPRLTTAQFRNQIASFRGTNDTAGNLRQLCETALGELRLPDGLGFFVDETPSPGLSPISRGAAIAILAARSGPLYLPGRFEPSLITAGAVTLFFPSLAKRGGIR